MERQAFLRMNSMVFITIASQLLEQLHSETALHCSLPIPQAIRSWVYKW